MKKLFLSVAALMCATLMFSQNTSDVKQAGGTNSADVNQAGINESLVDQNGDANIATVAQDGDLSANYSDVFQQGTSK